MKEQIEKMATCNDCIHYGICTFHITGNENEKCPHYTPTADVVPKSEVENIISNQRQRLNEYKKQIVTLQEKLDQAKADSAKEIFEEILKIKGLELHDWEAIAELKKKFEEKYGGSQ